VKRSDAASLLAANSSGGFRVLRGPGALGDLEHLYRYLWARTDPMPPMLDFDWVRTWWDLHAREGSLFIVQLERDGRPVALAPLYIRRREATTRGFLKTVCFLGTGENAAEEVYGTNNGWLGAAEHHADMTVAVAQALQQHRGAWDRLWLANFAPDAGIAGRLQTQLGESLTTADVRSSCNWVVDVPTSLADYFAAIPKPKLRTKLRAVLKKADQAEVVMRRAESADDALSMFDELIHLHTRQWRERGDTGACSSPVFREFHRQMIATYARQGRLWLFRFSVGDQLVAVRYLLQAGRRLYGYLSGIAMEHRGHAPGILSTLRLLEMGPDVGIDSIDLLAGDYGYKHRLATRKLPIATLDAYGRTPAARAWLALRQVRQRIRAGTNPERAES